MCLVRKISAGEFGDAGESILCVIGLDEPCSAFHAASHVAVLIVGVTGSLITCSVPPNRYNRVESGNRVWVSRGIGVVRPNPARLIYHLRKQRAITF